MRRRGRSIPTGYTKVGGRPRYGWFESGKASDSWSQMMFDQIATGTFYHREPMDVKIHVGWLGFVSVTIKILMVAFVIFQILTTNVYLDSIVPMGDISHWAGGDSRVLDRADAQETNTTLCQYDRSYDYKFDLDNKWDYSGARCERTPLSQLTFKSPQAMHFISFEQQMQEVSIKRTGESCDEECQTVYPEWPAEATYGDKSFQSAYVTSQEEAALRAAFPNMTIRRASNVHLEKPTRTGPADQMCRCFSIQNIFHLGIDSAEFQFTYGYDSPSQSGSSKGTDEHAPTGFIFGDGEEPIQVIEKGSYQERGPARFTVEEALAAVGTCLDCQPEGNFYTNSLCPNGECPSPYQPKPVPRISGIQISIQTEYYNHETTMPKGGRYDWVRKNYEPPYAIHVLRKVEDWTSRGSDITVLESTPDKVVTVDRYLPLAQTNPEKLKNFRQLKKSDHSKIKSDFFTKFRNKLCFVIPHPTRNDDQRCLKRLFEKGFDKGF